MIIVAINGKMGSGKGELTKALSQAFRVRKLSFSTPIKETIKLMDKNAPKDLDLQENKNKYSELYGTTYRVVMQSLGDMHRNVFGKDFFVNQLERRIQDIGEATIKDQYDIIVVDDVRYLNEIERLEGLGAITIRIEVDRIGTAREHQHSSEVSLDNYKYFQYRLINDMSPMSGLAAPIIKEIKARL
jgi:hypothetical protein